MHCSPVTPVRDRRSAGSPASLARRLRFLAGAVVLFGAPWAGSLALLGVPRGASAAEPVVLKVYSDYV